MKKICVLILICSLLYFIFGCEKESLNDELSFSNQEYSSSLNYDTTSRIGIGTSSFEQFDIFEQFRYSFESDLEGWTDGGSDCERVDDFASDGNWSIRIRDNTGINASITSPVWDLSAVSTIDITFSFYARSMEAGESFYIEFYDGSNWSLMQIYTVGADFTNNDYNTKTITLNSDLTSESQIRFICDASTNSDMIYLDNIILTGDDVVVIPPITRDTIFFDITNFGVWNHSGYPDWAVFRFIPKSPNQYGTAAIFSQLTQIVPKNNLRLDLCIVRAEYSNYGNRFFEITRTQEGVYTSQYTTLEGFTFAPTDLVPGPNQHIVFIEKEIPRSPAPGIPDFYGVITPDFSGMPIAFVASKDFQTGNKLGLAIK